MNIYLKSFIITSLEWFGMPAFIYFLIWNPFDWNFGLLSSSTSSMLFWGVISIVSIITVVVTYKITVDKKYKLETTLMGDVSHSATITDTLVNSTDTPQSSDVIKAESFRDTLFSMLSELKDSLDHILGSEQDAKTNIILLSGKEIFLALVSGGIIYNGQRYEINKNEWLDEGGRENIKKIISIIKEIEDYIENSDENSESKKFHLKLLNSYIGASETIIIGDILKEMNIKLLTIK